ncbi:hypothetical protein [Acidocella sp. KAb 2-4]|uniref:hypothetical protein n=1 Tax=Acidocella sp. KAb 2-4 TaxID=2885158 RepID=UPI001D06ABD0|nr:hypothetical protein [Acidocella sp. KAb 2-4]MCB5944118.1 hypothetical protein [Acidocella sp. KAb 2-4]
MSKVTLTLGGVAFRDMEVPEAIGFGGRQRVAVQELLGGGRAVQVLGVDEGVITFSGIFSGGMRRRGRSCWTRRGRRGRRCRWCGTVLPIK